jgi:hypothetical protein
MCSSVTGDKFRIIDAKRSWLLRDRRALPVAWIKLSKRVAKSEVRRQSTRDRYNKLTQIEK